MAIRVIVAGAGGRGRDWMREVGRESGFELSACVDVDEDALRQSASLFALAPARCFRSLAEALDATPCDAAIISTPADLHAEACETALRRGRAVLVEKPFTTNLSDAVRLVRLAEE